MTGNDWKKIRTNSIEEFILSDKFISEQNVTFGRFPSDDFQLLLRTSIEGTKNYLKPTSSPTPTPPAGPSSSAPPWRASPGLAPRPPRSRTSPSKSRDWLTGSNRAIRGSVGDSVRRSSRCGSRLLLSRSSRVGVKSNDWNLVGSDAKRYEFMEEKGIFAEDLHFLPVLRWLSKLFEKVDTQSCTLVVFVPSQVHFYSRGCKLFLLLLAPLKRSHFEREKKDFFFAKVKYLVTSESVSASERVYWKIDYQTALMFLML